MTLGYFTAFPASDLILVIFLLLRLIKKAFHTKSRTGSNLQTLITLGVRHREGLSDVCDSMATRTGRRTVVGSHLSRAS
jgi:hypothetical protein